MVTPTFHRVVLCCFLLLFGTSQAAAESRDRTARSRPAWELLESLSDVESLAIDRFVPSVLYASTSSGLYISWSYGERWLRRHSEGGTVLSDPNRPGAALLASGSTLFETDDAGLSWREIGAIPGRLLAIAPDNPNVLWANQAIFLLESNDRGRSWTRIPFPGPGSCCEEMIALSERNIYATASISQLSHSYDGGDTWPVSTFAELYFVASFAVTGRRPDVVFAGARMGDPVYGLTGLRRSNDGGRTWFVPNESFADAVVSQLVLSPVDGRLYMVAAPDSDGDFHVYTSESGGDRFELAEAGLDPGGVSLLLPHPRLRCVAFAVVDGRLYRTWNGGGTCG